MIKLNSKVKFESLATPGRWFRGRVYGIIDEGGKKYVLMDAPDGSRMYPHFVEYRRLSEDK